MSENYKPMVNHLTRIILKLIDEPIPYEVITKIDQLTPDTVRQFGGLLASRAERVAQMMEALQERGFTLKFEKDRVVADSSEVEAQDAKAYLIARGFQDREFQVYLEYARKWGVM